MTARHLATAFAACAVAALVGCSTPATRVVLLPQDDGKPSAVVVRARNGEQTLSRPYQRATARAEAPGAPVLDNVDPAQLRSQNSALFDLVPPKVSYFTLNFDPGDRELAARSQARMREVIAAAQARPGGDIIVIGYTDTRGDSAYNDELSRRRAQQIRQTLIDIGFPAARIEAVGRGERELLIQTADDVSEPRNRRVTIEVR